MNPIKPNAKMRCRSVLALALAAMTSGALAQNAAPPAARPSPGAELSSFLSTFYVPDGTSAKTQTVWFQAIAVSSPAYCSDIKGDVTVTFKAPGMTQAKALCWQQPTAANPSPWGHDVDLAPDLQLDAAGNGSFVFPADQFPSGPLNLRIHAKDGGNRQDYCELQLFNQGGVAWNQGIPTDAPPAAKGMKLAFADDFAGPLSLAKARNDLAAKYWTHWGGGDGSIWPFTDNAGPLNPFSQVGTFLRIHATKPAGTRGAAGTLTPVRPDGTGFTATAPCYFECRLLAQNAPGTWPAFWATTQGGGTAGCDEMDALEGYGTNARSGGIWTVYHATTHFWGQPTPAWVKEKLKGPDGNPYDAHKRVDTMAVGGKSSWSTTFHTYGFLVTPSETAYYFDNIEVMRHPSGKLAATLPIGFLVNLAIGGGGWQPNLARYGNQSDMWVDYVRVYQGEPNRPSPAKKP
ncbi:MAG: family 16 glycosylhydrolase [Lentisphaeria bacterium]|jgi:hypothetical protein